ncbi:MAG: M1 family metallopeptidase, partial [Chitinophagaceae bacterium]|nr:M1 family metallopeptidase [Chitinophagaceae bacterium]
MSFCLAGTLSFAQFTKQDTMRGSVTPARAWWDVVRYDLEVTPDYDSKSIIGRTSMKFKKIKAGQTMQIDLQAPMMIDSFYLATHHPGMKDRHWRPESTSVTREGNVWLIEVPASLNINSYSTLVIYYQGRPKEAINPPWDGGWIWKKDDKGRPWMSVACQVFGASAWYPCKDHQADEPDQGASLAVTVTDSLAAIGNGRLARKSNNGNGTTTWVWNVTNPINNYNIVPYIGMYVHWQDAYNGKLGKLDLDYWVLDYSLDNARKQFGKDVKPMMACFEDWFGPFPFYKDGYKLVESPHLGMEHQSAIAYGNKFMDGYKGADLSGTGWGNRWDYIIIHESGHEWFGNNITTKDIADMWVHEGFTNYSEVLFVECQYGKAAANAYCKGIRGGISNDKPVIGRYGLNKEGSGDMYAKGANLIHTIR